MITRLKLNLSFFFANRDLSMVDENPGFLLILYG
jgi:hypothetical protein